MLVFDRTSNNIAYRRMSAGVIQPDDYLVVYPTGKTFLDVTQGGTGNASGNAPSAAKLATARTINGVPFDGSANIVIETGGSDPWAMQPIGVPIPVFDHMAGVTAPPTNQAYRYIKLTAADSYNTGTLSSEVVTGSAPLVIATATIALVGSPINGLSVSLINTERRVIRAGSSGTVEADRFQGARFSVPLQVQNQASGAVRPSILDSSYGFDTTLRSQAIAGSSWQSGYSGTTGEVLTDGTNGTPRIGIETRAKSIGATFYMRIK